MKRMKDVEIVRCNWEDFPLSQEDLADVNRLLPQLSPNEELLTRSANIALYRKSELVVARDVSCPRIDGEGIIVAMARVDWPDPPDGSASVEKVVTDKTYRGHGISRYLNELIIENAHLLKLERLTLHSRRSRVEAHALYRNLGYQVVREDPERIYFVLYLTS